ncbi:MAG: ribonuclease H-like domain-containing protein [Candidatus Hodarchaeales archaeon]|jgi:uncharacterized protein YprB with RNaseH-like and TPR domain
MRKPRRMIKKKSQFNRVAKRLRDSVDSHKEYEIIDDDTDEGSQISFYSQDLFFNEFEEARKLKRSLLKEYEGRILDEVFRGRITQTKFGNCYYIKSQKPVKIRTISSRRARDSIISDLKLILGIGEITELKLKNSGYQTIEDLVKHPRFGHGATCILDLLDECDTRQLIERIWRKFPKSHPLVLFTSGFHDKEDFIIFDIETMGLFNRPIILIGLAEIRDGHVHVHQYFTRDVAEEPAQLHGFVSRVSKTSALVSFNGRSFDLPYINDRLAYYRMKRVHELPHYDLLHFSRRAWKEKLPNCKLTTIEKHLLGIQRYDDVPSALVPDFFDTYRKKKNVGPIVPIIEHNKQDVISLAHVYSRLLEAWE